MALIYHGGNDHGTQVLPAPTQPGLNAQCDAAHIAALTQQLDWRTYEIGDIARLTCGMSGTQTQEWAAEIQRIDTASAIKLVAAVQYCLRHHMPMKFKFLKVAGMTTYRIIPKPVGLPTASYEITVEGPCELLET